VSPRGTGRSAADRTATGASAAPVVSAEVGTFAHEVLAVVFQVREGRLCVLLWRRGQNPHRGRWSLPGGPLGVDERLGASAARHLADKVDVDELAHLEQLETRSDPRRDPRGRVLATAYLGLVPLGSQPTLPADTSWHPVDALPRLAFDHESIIVAARERLRGKFSYTTIASALARPSFTVSQLREIYRAVLGYDVSATNLQRVLNRRHALEPTGGTSNPGADGGRPARTYRFAQPQVQITDPFAAFRPPS
jgi:ADP-ribose pyrophosphatase YjhB (NUDIX family)